MMAGDVDLTRDYDEADLMRVCFLQEPEDVFELMDDRTDGGSYICWDHVHRKWVRSGKAVDFKARKKQHDLHVKTKTSTFYVAWMDLDFYTSFGFNRSERMVLSRAMYVSPYVKHQLGKGTWGGASKSGEEREMEMMDYLVGAGRRPAHGRPHGYLGLGVAWIRGPLGSEHPKFLVTWNLCVWTGQHQAFLPADGGGAAGDPRRRGWPILILG